MAYAKLRDGTTKLGERNHLSGQFFFNGQLICLGGYKDRVTVSVKALWDTVVCDDLMEDVKVTHHVFCRTEIKSKDFACGIVNGAMKGGMRASRLKPCKRAGIALDKEAQRRHAVTRLAASCWFVGMGQGNPCGFENAADGSR